MNRVVITGMGIWSCVGQTIEQVAESLEYGRSGIILDPVRKEMGFRSALTGVVPTPNLKGRISRRDRIGMAEQTEYAYEAAIQAIQWAGLEQSHLHSDRTGILFGNDSSSKSVVESVDTLRAKGDTTLIGSGSIFQSINSSVTMNLATLFGIRGANLSVSAACASGSHAVGLAYLLIRSGMQDCVIAGGAQEVNPISMISFDAIGAFSCREDSPTTACRPFDKDRDGLIPSGGAACLILESYEHASQRGVQVLGEIVGYGFSSNGEHISKPSTDGAYRSMQSAILDARISPDSIDYINAHATSTLLGDICEAEAILRIFNGRSPFVSSTKSMTGHECWMAGASELVYSLIMMKNGFIAPNVNFVQADSSVQDLKVVTKAIEQKMQYCMSNSFGFGGTNSTIIIKKPI